MGSGSPNSHKALTHGAVVLSIKACWVRAKTQQAPILLALLFVFAHINCNWTLKLSHRSKRDLSLYCRVPLKCCIEFMMFSKYVDNLKQTQIFPAFSSDKAWRDQCDISGASLPPLHLTKHFLIMPGSDTRNVPPAPRMKNVRCHPVTRGSRGGANQIINCRC